MTKTTTMNPQSDGELLPTELLPPTELLATEPAAMPAPDLATALQHGEELLEERTRLFSALEATHYDIPRLLGDRIRHRAELAAAELAGGDVMAATAALAATELSRVRSVRSREASVSALLAQQGELTAARAQLDQARGMHAAAVIEEFEERYSAAVAALQTLWLEAETLSSTLRSEVPAEVPCRITGMPPAPTDDQKQLGHLQPAGSPKLVKIMGDAVAPVIDQTAARVGACLDQLDGAIQFCNGVKTAQLAETQLRTRPDPRGGWDPNGVFDVVQSFTSHVDQLQFVPGQFVDTSLVPPVTLQRLLVGRAVRQRFSSV